MARNYPASSRLVRDVTQSGFAWRETGAGDLVLFLHGLCGTRLSWTAQLEGLGDTFRCVAWDAPGYGESAPLSEGVTFPALADAVVSLLDVLEVERCHLVGLSFGGMICQYAAATHPSRIGSVAILSSSPAFGLDGTTAEAWRAARLAPLEAGEQPASFAERVLRGIAGPGISEEALEGQRLAMSRITAGGLRQAIDCLVTHDARHLLSRIEAPTLVLVGELDTETPPAYAAALANDIPGAELVLIAGAGHLLNAEAPSPVNAALRHHLRMVGGISA